MANNGNGKQVKIRQPTEVKVGARTYTIDWSQDGWQKSQDGEHDARSAWATTNHEKLTIHIKPTLASYNKRCTLLHEILHALFSITGADVRNAVGNSGEDFELEEYLICRLEEPLMSVLIDNPELLAYLVIGKRG